MNFIANYYGEKIGFYYAWIMFYTSWLLIPAIPGAVLFGYQMYLLISQYVDKETVNIDNPFNLLYCLILAIWSTVMIEVWKRVQNEIAFMWSMTNFSEEEQVMADYRADYVPDPKFYQVLKISFLNTLLRRVTGEFPIIIIAVAIVVGCFYGETTIKLEHPKSSVYSLGASVSNSVAIVVLGQIYRLVALALVNWENHKYQNEWENSLVIKQFAF